jgi:HTH-type transcriptional regulator/antitoxin HigA
MSSTFDQDTYGRLLSEVAPKLIETEEEYTRFLAAAEKLVFKQDLTSEEAALLNLLVMVIEPYEEKNYAIGTASPPEILRHLMASNGVRQVDLVGIVGSKGVVSEVVNGKRKISKAQAKAIGDRFKVSPALFI